MGKSTRKITMPMAMAIRSLEGAEVAGYDIPRLLRKAGIDEAWLDRPKARVPVDQFVRLIRYTTGVMNDELHGLIEKPARIGNFRAMALSAVHAQTLGRALQRSVDFYNLFENSLHYELVISAGQAEFRITRRANHLIRNTLAIESVLTIQHRFFGWLVNERILLNQVKVDYKAHEYSREYRFMFYDAPILFEQKASGFSFDKSYLDRPIVQNEEAVESYVRRGPMDIYLPLDAGGRFTIEVRDKVDRYIKKYEQVPELSDIAESMDLHPQALRRRLKQEGSSFHVIIAQVRRDIAIFYLGQGALSIEEIAYKAGYTESGAFIRAFKNWTGFTPLNFRKGLDS